MKDRPGIYTSVGYELCFINYATDCLTGSRGHHDYYDYSDTCSDWVENERKTLDDSIAFYDAEVKRDPTDLRWAAILKKKKKLQESLEIFVENTCPRGDQPRY